MRPPAILKSAGRRHHNADCCRIPCAFAARPASAIASIAIRSCSSVSADLGLPFEAASALRHDEGWRAALGLDHGHQCRHARHGRLDDLARRPSMPSSSCICRSSCLPVRSASGSSMSSTSSKTHTGPTRRNGISSMRPARRLALRSALGPALADRPYRRAPCASPVEQDPLLPPAGSPARPPVTEVDQPHHAEGKLRLCETRPLGRSPRPPRVLPRGAAPGGRRLTCQRPASAARCAAMRRAASDGPDFPGRFSITT